MEERSNLVRALDGSICGSRLSGEVLRTRRLEIGHLVTNCAGHFELIPDRVDGSPMGEVALVDPKSGKAFDRLSRLAQVYAGARRRAMAGILDYLILVPTLRCNL